MDLRISDGIVRDELAKPMWVPAVNNHGGLGTWAFVEVLDPWDCEDQIREATRA